LGNSTINKDFKTKPSENKRKESVFQCFWNKIINTNNITTFISESYSPSAYVVKKLGDKNYNDLKKLNFIKLIEQQIIMTKQLLKITLLSTIFFIYGMTAWGQIPNHVPTNGLVA
jgi:hypothetical protein